MVFRLSEGLGRSATQLCKSTLRSGHQRGAGATKLGFGRPRRETRNPKQIRLCPQLTELSHLPDHKFVYVYACRVLCRRRLFNCFEKFKQMLTNFLGVRRRLPQLSTFPNKNGSDRHMIALGSAMRMIPTVGVERVDDH
ncbi:hypothetical protein BN874_1420002 [Candidatus Contendobacter odensis Run_B_J11]|uniref:Uncharacterized protein n=1 Tax=Candidatus Contendobacter odensis Run_B_J11 TaxID=1400861 RepID=A0A7U7G8Y4_9GAMM|nr:hypothetical protein BN874_1420002 [Candidatus Contendobacter odensis Run_B_J11]